jgi:hypothetical protein
MFAFHETTRKRICRMAFFALCAAPTIATAAWIAEHYWPGRQGRVARQLGDVLDVHVKLADWREPRPRVTRSSGLVLSDPSSGYALADLRTLEVQGGRLYSISEITVDAAQLPRLAEHVHRWLTKLPPTVHEVRISQLTIKLADKAADGPGDLFILHDVRGRIDRDAAGRTQAVLAGAANSGASDPAALIRLTLAPPTEGDSAAPTVSLETHSATVPARLLAAVAPGFERLGPAARFAGAVRWSLDQPELRGMVQGRLDAVDMSGLLSAGSPHRLRGMALIELAELSWRGSRIERLAGSIVAEHAQMSRSLLEALVANFRCPQGSDGVPMASDPEMISLDFLATAFQLKSDGLTFWGHCPPEANMQDGCIAVSGMQPLLIAPPYRDWPLGVLVQTLAGQSASWLPASREAVDIASRLPLPLK